MVFDSKEHQQIVLQLINQAQFPGALLEKASELKSSVVNAEINAQDVPAS